MNHFFHLQYLRLNRRWRAWGCPPMLGYLLVVIVFFLFSILLFEQTILAKWVYPIIVITVVAKLGEIRRNDFLKLIFTQKDYRKVRMVENVLIVLPFALFLGFQKAWAIGLGVLVAGIGMVLLPMGWGIQKTIPTPFGQLPYEFPQGVRYVWPLVFFLGFVLLMGIRVDNPNLSITVLVFIHLLPLSFYTTPEPAQIIWSFKHSPQQFLTYKIKQACWNQTKWTFPFLMPLFYFFSGFWKIILLIQLLGYAYLVAMVLVKYACFPKEIHIGAALMLAVGYVLPIALPLLLVYFYQKAKKNLGEHYLVHKTDNGC